MWLTVFLLYILFLVVTVNNVFAQQLDETIRAPVDSSEWYDAEGDLIAPEEAVYRLDPEKAVNRPEIEFKRRKETEADRIRKKLPPKYEDDRSLCYCNYGTHMCGFNNGTCFKHLEAACFHYAEQIYDEEEGAYVTKHKFGCAPLTQGSGGSYFTCKANLVLHGVPKAIACCYEGDFCNQNLTLPEFLLVERGFFSSIFFVILFICICLVLAFFLLLLFIRFMANRLKDPLKNTIILSPCTGTEKSLMMADMSSGSGSGFASLNEKTVAQCLEMLDVIGRGRYGEVKKALYKGDRIVAVKSFCTREEESWKNEKEIYQTQMLNHENILQYVAADISSQDSITVLLLITDFHELGSLYEYLQHVETLTPYEALKLAESAASGLVHLHSKVKGTGTPVKPRIAHRDVKSKNMIVKRPGVCCVADFGLALTEDMVNDGKMINIQVGTKRYMAPEVLDKTLNEKNFTDFTIADVYSFSLVIWEILRNVQESRTRCKDSQCDSGFGSTGSGSKIAGMSRTRFLGSGLTYRPSAASSHDSSSTETLRRPIQPYEEMTQSDPTLEDMRQVVCVQKKRPIFDEALQQDEILEEVCSKVEECWNWNTNVRPAIMGVKKTLSGAVSKLEKKGLLSEMVARAYGTPSPVAISIPETVVPD